MPRPPESAARPAPRGPRRTGGLPRRAPAPGPPAPALPPPPAGAAAWGPPALLFVALMAAYALTACPTVGPGDAGELTSAMCSWGVAHAPGYPLLMLIGNLVSHLPHPGEPAWILNRLDAAFAAAACAVLAAAVATLTGRPWAGVVAGLALGSSRVFWEYALVVEVFSLNALMAALLLWLLTVFVRGAERERPILWPLPASALVMSTAITHHLTLALLAVPVLVVLALALASMRRRKQVAAPALRRALLASVLAGALGLLPLLYIPLAARLDPPLNWGNARDLPALWRLLARRDFGSGWLTPADVLVGRLLEAGESASPFPMRHFGFLGSGLPRDFGWAFPVLVALGIGWAARRSRRIALAGALFLLVLALFYARMNAPVTPLYVGITRPFQILPHVVLALFAGLGVALLLERAARAGRGAVAALLVIVLAATGGAMLAVNGPRVRMRDNTFTRDFGSNLLSTMPREAIYLSNGDLFRNSILYQQLALGRRRDVSMLEQPMLSAAWYVEQVRRRGPVRLPPGMSLYSDDPRTQSRAWLDLNVPPAPGAARPVLATAFLDDTWRSGYRMVPFGLWSRVETRDTRPALRAWARTWSDDVARWQVAGLGRSYAETGWETSEGVWYTYSLANLQALRQICTALDPATPPWNPLPALGIAERWPAGRRADFLAYQAEFWRTFPSESLAAAPADRFAGPAMNLARAALTLEANDLQALQTIAALMSTVPRYRDPLGEARIRHRIVEQRPADLTELEPYFQLVTALMRDPATRDPEIYRTAEADRMRYLRVLDLCIRVWKHPRLIALRDRWAAPLPRS